MTADKYPDARRWRDHQIRERLAESEAAGKRAQELLERAREKKAVLDALPTITVTRGPILTPVSSWPDWSPSPRAENHEPDCRSWLPDEQRCHCQGDRYIIIAPTFTAGRDYLMGMGLSGLHHRIVWHREGIPFLEDLPWPLPEPYRLEIIGYPESLFHGSYIREALRDLGVPDAEIYEQDMR